VFVHDSYYEPLLTFAGWRKIETYNNGEITAWSKDDVPPAHKIESDAVPPPWQGLMWGTLPMASSILAIGLVLLLPGRRKLVEPVEIQTSREREREHYVAEEVR
jgi:hypothetical protein